MLNKIKRFKSTVKIFFSGVRAIPDKCWRLPASAPEELRPWGSADQPRPRLSALHFSSFSLPVLFRAAGVL